MNKFLLDHLGNKPFTDLAACLSLPPWPLFLLLFVAVYVAYAVFSDTASSMVSSINQILALTTAMTFLINAFFPLQANTFSILFEVYTSLRVRFSHFQLDHLPIPFKRSLEEELNRILTMHRDEKAPKYSKSLTTIASKPATHATSQVSSSISVPIANSEYKTAAQSSSVAALETKYDPQLELSLSEAARCKRLGSYIPQQIFGYDVEQETVTLHLPDKEQPFIYKMGYPNYSLFQLWTAKVNRADPYQKFLVYFTCSMLNKVPDDILSSLRKTASFKHVVGDTNQAGFVDISHKVCDQKNFPLRPDSQGKLQSALFKIKPRDSEWRMPVYLHEQVISSEGQEYALCVTGEPLRIKHG